MGFSTVYRCLRELFPQLDARMLKAIAIENSKDVNAAVEVILSHVLPYTSAKEQSLSSNVQYPRLHTQLVKEVGQKLQSSLLGYQHTVKKKDNDSSEFKVVARRDDGTILGTGNSLEKTPASGSEKPFTKKNSEQHPALATEEAISWEKGQVTRVILLDKSKDVQSSSVLPPHHSNHEVFCGSVESEEVIFLGTTNEPNGISGRASHTAQTKSSNNSTDRLTAAKFDQRDCCGSQADDCDLHDSHQAKSTLISTPVTVNSVCELAFTLVREHNSVAPEGDDKEEERVAIAEQNNEDESTYKVTHSDELSGADVVKKITENATAYKQTLSAMDSVINIIGEVQAKQGSGGQAKEEGAWGGQDICHRVEQIKQMLEHTKQACCMHTGEVYRERAILSTEIRELQSCLLSMSDEEDKTLAIIDQMQQALESQLAVADDLKVASEKEKLDKEEAARISLAEQEALIKKVLHESRLLQEEAEQNKKLREFLMHQGHVVDSLQGEMAVICQNVKLLKEKFDQGVTSSKYILRSRTGHILAPSSSLGSMPTKTILDCSKTFKNPIKRGTPSSSNAEVSSLKSVSRRNTSALTIKNWIMKNGNSLKITVNADVEVQNEMSSITSL